MHWDILQLTCTYRLSIALSFHRCDLAPQMTGILGYKAYRCLNSSRFVLAMLSVLRLAMVALLIVSLSRLNVPRRLSGLYHGFFRFSITC